MKLSPLTSRHVSVMKLENLLTLPSRAVAGLDDRLSKLINNSTTDSSTLETRLTNTMKQLIEPLKQQLDFHLPHPGTKDAPANSCKDLHKTNPNTPSGYYWIKQSSGSPVSMYCSMSGTCGNETGGWMRVANIDMRNTSQSCPSGLHIATAPKRICDIWTFSCVSNMFSALGVQYGKVCGKVIAYQRGIPRGFKFGNRGIEGNYIHGVSFTHGRNPRKHIWSFAGAADETTSNVNYKCPCIHPSLTSSRIPSFVGNDYFCDTAYRRYYTNYYPYLPQAADPLWDGKGCGPHNTCCSFNNPPWFVKNLSSITTNDIEMRMCRPESSSLPIEIVELYVQ